jgi:phage terminase small subunit
MSDKPLPNRKYEVIAQQLARGATAIEASLAAGYRSDGSAFAANCRQRAAYPQIKARVAALQAKALEKVNLDLGWILERLVEIARRGPYRERVRTSDSLRAIDMLLRIGGHYAPAKSIVTPGESRSVRLTEIFDGEQLKTRRRVVDLVQVINDENCPASVRIEAAKAAVPFLEGKEFVTEDDGGREP